MNFHKVSIIRTVSITRCWLVLWHCCNNPVFHCKLQRSRHLMQASTSLFRYDCIRLPALRQMWGRWINSYPPSVAYMRRWTESSLVQVMACRLFSVKPLPEPMMIYCQLDPQENISVTFKPEFKKYIFENVVCQNGGHFAQGRWVFSSMHL